MAKRETEFAPGCYYHLYNRGAHRRSIFYTDEDYRAFLTRLKGHVRDCHIAVIAYCLMPNHFHLLVRQKSTRKAGLAVQFACTGYTQWFNLRHQHEGTLFQGRYQSLLIDNDEYLRHLCRYIHANPVKDGFASEPELWPYSNYLEWIGRRHGSLVDRNFIAAFFPVLEDYASSVKSYIAHGRDLPQSLARHLAELECE